MRLVLIFFFFEKLILTCVFFRFFFRTYWDAFFELFRGYIPGRYQALVIRSYHGESTASH